MTAILQGIIAGGAVAYLCTHTEVQAQREAAKTRELVALQANHALLLVGVVFAQAAVTSVIFTLIAKTVLVLTPVVVLGNIVSGNQPLSASEKAWTTRLSRGYLVAAAVCSVAVVLLGGYAFGLSALAVLTAKVAVQRHWISAPWHAGFGMSTAGMAGLAALGYAAWIVIEGSPLSRLALLATALLLPISWWVRTPAEAAPAHQPFPRGVPPPPPLPPASAPPQREVAGPPGGPAVAPPAANSTPISPDIAQVFATRWQDHGSSSAHSGSPATPFCPAGISLYHGP